MLAFLLLLTTSAPYIEPPEHPHPWIAGTCIFGIIRQVGMKVTISGPGWTAEGEIQSPGKECQRLVLRWMSPSKRPALGIYRIEGNGLYGDWEYMDRMQHSPRTGDPVPMQPETLFISR